MAGKIQIDNRKTSHTIVAWVLFGLLCIACNLLLSRLTAALGLPLYLDVVGTLVAASLGGYMPAIIIAFATNLLKSIFSPLSIYYASIHMAIAIVASIAVKRGWLRSLKKSLLSVLLLAAIGGGMGSVLTWLLYDMNIGQVADESLAWRLLEWGIPLPFLAQLLSDFAVDFLDKGLSVLLVLLILRLLPEKLKDTLRFSLRNRISLSQTVSDIMAEIRPRKTSLRTSITVFIVLSMIVIAVVTTGISFYMFRDSLISAHEEMGRGVSNVIASLIDGDRVEEFMTLGEAAPGYLETELAMKDVHDSSGDIQYVYVYQIREDGCHVVFDLDVDDLQGAAPGDIIPFDPSFMDVVPTLLAGDEIAPIVSNDSYGWLLSIYKPVKNSAGETTCYAAVDIAMSELAGDELVFVVKVLSLFISFTILIVAVLLMLAEYGIIAPIDAMAAVSENFAFTSEHEREKGVEHIRRLNIHTGNEIENLYLALTKTMEDSVQYIADSQEKNETIDRMQENLIAVLADMVESRDLYTGNHIKNTANYVRIILEQMMRDGVYADQIDGEYIEKVVRSAPLHDVGKIRVSDTLLNKPGKLTPVEFEEMKKHTIYGQQIIQDARSAASDDTYLDEAERLAAGHHERWDGAGYPNRLKGEEIPLSARVMAVADVFDALVSKRSYKEGFSLEKSLEIIREESGTHFDPQVVDAFLKAEDRVRMVYEQKI